MQISLTASGSVEDYDDTLKGNILKAFAIAAKIADADGNPPDGSILTVTAASVILVATFPVISNAAASSATDLLTTTLSSPEAVTALFEEQGITGVTAESAPIVETVSGGGGAIGEQQVAAGPLPPSLMLIVIIVLLALCLLCSFCSTWLFCRHVLPSLRDGAASQQTMAKGAGADGDDDAADEDDEPEDVVDTINSFLDPAWLQGMDDAPDLEINPVLRYKVDEEKREALRRAAEEAGQGGGSSTAQRGVPGAIARLGWYLDDSKNDNKEEQRIKEKRRHMKNIEGFLQRTFEADVTHPTLSANTVAGGVKFNALDMAKRTEVERVGGARESTLMLVAQKSRSQLAHYLATHPAMAAQQMKSEPATG